VINFLILLIKQQTNMIDFFCIFSTGGLILWFKQFATFNVDLINLLIRNILMDEKRNQDYYTVDGIVMRWKVVNDKGLIFTAAYQQSYGEVYVDVLLDMVEKDFIATYHSQIKKIGKVYVECPNFTDRYLEILDRWEKICKEKIT